MKPLTSHVVRDHVLIGGIAAILFMPYLGVWGSLLFWLANIFIDLDHYLNFVYRTHFKFWSVTDMFNFHEELFKRRNRPEFLTLEIFHTVEFLFVMGLIFSVLIPTLRPVFYGACFHMVVDFVHLGRHGILTKRSHSFIEYFWRTRKMRALGHNPSRIFQESIELLYTR